MAVTFSLVKVGQLRLVYRSTTPTSFILPQPSTCANSELLVVRAMPDFSLNSPSTQHTIAIAAGK